MENRRRQTAQISVSPYFKNPLKDTFQLNKNISMMRASISTSKSKNLNDDGSLDKVKIKALPHHKHINFSKNQNFITVFQAIQIERLSDEIQTQRKKLRELQRQIINAQNYQVQIKQLSDKCTNLQEQITEYQDELSKMNTICQKLYHQNDSLKQKSKINQKQSQQDKVSDKNIQFLQIQPQIIRPQQRKSSLKKTSQRVVKNVELQENQKSDKDYLRKLLQQSQQNLKLVNERMFALEKRDTDITQYQLMIQGLTKQIQTAMVQNQKLHEVLKQKSLQVDKWQKTAMSTANGNNTFYIFQKDDPKETIVKNNEPSDKQKIDILSKEILRLTQLIISKNNNLLNLQQSIVRKENQQQQLKINSNQKLLQNQNSNQNIIQLQQQLEVLKTQLLNCHNKLQQKTAQCNNMRRNQSAIFKDLQQINKLRLVCENQQSSILQNIKQYEKLKISNKNYEKLLAAEQLKNSQISLKLQQYLKRSNISKSNYFVESTCVNTGNFPFIKNPQKQNIQFLFSRIHELQDITKELKQNYNNLLLQTSRVYSECFPIKLGESTQF